MFEKYPILVSDVDNGVSYACVRVGCMDISTSISILL